MDVNTQSLSTSAEPTAPNDALLWRRAGRRREDRIVGVSRSTRRAVSQAEAAAGSDLPVRIVGPPGSGRSLIARTIHESGPRATRPFVTLRCGGIPPALQAREILGASGNGSADGGSGALARAAGGTLYLADADRLQPGLLARVCGAAGPNGSAGHDDADAARPRLIASLEPGSDVALFEEELHHEVHLAPLAERPEDILPLAAHFLQIVSEEKGLPARGFTAEARGALLTEPWPGNARELRERVRAALPIAEDGLIDVGALLLAVPEDEPPSFKEAKRAFEALYVRNLLQRCHGNISRAARLAKKDRKDFYDVLRRTGISASQYR